MTVSGLVRCPVTDTTGLKRALSDAILQCPFINDITTGNDLQLNVLHFLFFNSTDTADVSKAAFSALFCYKQTGVFIWSFACDFESSRLLLLNTFLIAKPMYYVVSFLSAWLFTSFCSLPFPPFFQWRPPFTV